MTPLIALLMFAAPAVLGAGVLLALALAAPRAKAPPEEAVQRGRVLDPLPAAVFAGAFWLADFGLNNAHPVWDKDGAKRFVAVALAGATVAIFHLLARRAPITVASRALLGVSITLAVLWPLAGGDYMPYWLLATLAASCAVWLPATAAALDAAPRSLPAFVAPAALALTATAAAPGIFESTYATGAMYAGTLAALAGGAAGALLLFRRRSPRGLPGAHTVWLAIFGAILLVTYAYQSVPAWWPLVVMALAPLGVLGARLRTPRWSRIAIALLLPALVAGGATVAQAVVAAQDGEDPYSGY